MSKNNLKSIRINQLIISFIFILLSIALIVWFFVMCRIEKVYVEGTIHTDETSIIESANIKIGSHTYSIDKEEIENRIKLENPYVKDVVIKRKGIKGLTINIEEYKPAYYYYTNNNYYIISSQYKIIEQVESIDDDFYNKSIELKLPKITSKKVGEILQFENEKDKDFTFNIINELMDSTLSVHIKSINLIEKFDIKVQYGAFYTIVFMEYIDFDRKLDACIRTIDKIKSDESYENVYGTIYVISDDKVSFVAQGRLDY